MHPAPATIAGRTDVDVLAALVGGSRLIALAVSEDHRLRFVNPAFDSLFHRPGGLIGVDVLDLVVPAHRETVDAALRGGSGSMPVCIVETSRDGAIFEVELQFERMIHRGQPLLAIFAQDVTDRARAEAQLNLLAYSDSLTGLGNRAMFADRLRQAALMTRRTAHPFAVLMLDLDGFKQINDRHGHDAGDLVLKRIASRLMASVRDTDTVARLGGDEFAVLLTSFAERVDAMTVAERLVELASQPIRFGDEAMEVGSSVGVAIYPEHAGTVEHLLAVADGAVYEAKRRGRGCIVWATEVAAAEVAPAPLTWSVAHEVGVAEIDEQHAVMVSLLNKLASELRNGEEHKATFREIVRYTEYHFAAEERLMSARRYPGAAAHEEMHRRLLDDLRGLRLDGESVSVSLTLRFLQEWLLRHVDGADRDLAVALLSTDRGKSDCSG